MKQKIHIILVILLLISAAITMVQSAQNQSTSNEPTILTKTPSKLWWMDGYRNGSVDYAYKPSADALTHAYHSNVSVLKENLGMYFVNPYNNTLFIVLKNLNENVEAEILRIMDPSKEVTVKFLKGPAILADLEVWEQKIFSKRDLLKSQRVVVNKISITENATIKVGIEEITTEKIETLKNTLRNDVPLDILVIYQLDSIVLTTGCQGPVVTKVQS